MSMRATDILSPIIARAMEKENNTPTEIMSLSGSDYSAIQSKMNTAKILEKEYDDYMREIVYLQDKKSKLDLGDANRDSINEQVLQIQLKLISTGKQLESINLEINKLITKDNYEVTPIVSVLSTISGAACAYHGYKRNKSVGWAIWWMFIGGLFPVIAPVVAYAQGFGKEREVK